MAVLLETSRGDIVIDLFVDECPTACKSFLKLCKIKYYNNCLFHNVQRNFIAQTGDPDGTGKGGSSIYGVMYGEQARFFEDEVRPHLKHKKIGTVGMASAGPNLNASQFYITTGPDLDSLDGKHTVFGQVAEGFDVLECINDAFCDDSGRPYQNIRIRHTLILDDPYPDPPQLAELVPEASPEPQFEHGDRLEDDWKPAQDTRPAEEIEEEMRKSEAHNRAVVLEMIGDLPDAEAKPPSNMLFVCKLNPVTTEEDLEIIFSRFGTVTSCDIIRDWKTGDSLCYGFIGFDSDKACEEAFFKMNNVTVDDRRIKVDFSQSVAHIWKMFKKGGRKGTAEMGTAAASHQRDERAAQQRLGGGRLELKSRDGQYGGRGGGMAGGSRGGGGRHALLLEPMPAEPEEEVDRVGGSSRRGEAPAGRREVAYDDRNRDRDRARERDGDRTHERQEWTRRSRSRSQERARDRDRERDKGRDMDRARASRDAAALDAVAGTTGRDRDGGRGRDWDGGRDRDRDGDGGRDRDGDRDRRPREQARERDRGRDDDRGRERDKEQGRDNRDRSGYGRDERREQADRARDRGRDGDRGYSHGDRGGDGRDREQDRERGREGDRGDRRR